MKIRKNAWMLPVAVLASKNNNDIADALMDVGRGTFAPLDFEVISKKGWFFNFEG